MTNDLFMNTAYAKSVIIRIEVRKLLSINQQMNPLQSARRADTL